MPLPPAPGMDPAFYTLSLLRRRKLDRCIDASTQVLERNPYDLQVWYVKTRALTLKNWIDDTEMEEEGVAEVLLDDNAMASAPRPGTSLQRPLSQQRGGTQGMRPVSNSGRPLSGYARPGSSSQRAPGSSRSVESAFQGNRLGTARPVTSSGRFVRLGTASMRSEPGGPFISADRIDFAKYAQRPPLAKVLCDYIVYHDHLPRQALELCAESTKATSFKDWWWKARLGKCYYQLGLLRDAEKQFKSSLKMQENITTLLELGKVYLRLDQPLTALEMFQKAVERNPIDHHLLLAIARIHDQLNDPDQAIIFYRKVLELDASNVEAIACIASNHFYEDQPEVALRLYRRLLQMGVNNAELWNNLGLCCFYASQYDITLSCFERALALAGDEAMPDIWYNIGQIAIGIGDVGLAYQAFKITVSSDPSHAEALNNLGILELRKGNVDQARNSFTTAAAASQFMHEPLFNAALLCYKLGEFQEAFSLVNKSLDAYPEHVESKELKAQLQEGFNAL